ncbi:MULTISPECIES: tyrosine-type recombinase/integrase [Ralstonia]|uniref:tyrosine-type recombinase/integrase n=1 Tax=Ralstonia TaxID=48736 RepID=UPI00038572B8|nr:MULTISPECIES: site-specific integrase [Ralstonia]EPX97868.1 hypothetical protein C404_11400 [Ralstonia sp. AU12-08]
MGTISERTNNAGAATFQAKVRRKGFPPLSQTFPTREEAESWLFGIEASIRLRSRAAAKRQAEAKLAAELQARPHIVADLLRRYLVEETPKKKGAGAEEYHVRSILDSPLALIHLENLTRRDLQDWRDQRLEQVKGSTVNRQLNILNAALKHARDEWGVDLPDSVIRSVRRPKNPASRVRRLSKAEEAAIRQAGEDTRNPYVLPILDLALETGMRRGEMLGLRWWQVSYEGRSVHLTDTKNGASRGVALSLKAMATLQTVRQMAYDTSAALNGPDERPVFPGVTPNALKLAFKRMLERAGVDDFHFHDLRHEATSRMFEKGLSAMEVASITGHKDIRVLQRYTHLQVKDLAAKLD